MNDTVKMIRYNGTKRNQRKNCLVTLRRGDTLFFGISRCNTKADKYDRQLGKSLAFGRANEAVEKFPEAAMYIDSTGLLGRCSVSNTKFLLRYFESLR